MSQTTVYDTYGSAPSASHRRTAPSRWTCSATPCGPRASTRRPTSTTTSRPASATTTRTRQPRRWTWPGVFPEGDPVAVLVRYHTPNVYAAVVVWYYVAPGVAMFIAGQFLISTSRIWFARMGGSLGLRSHLPAWPLKREQRMTDTEDRLRRTMEGIIQKFQSAPPHGGRRASYCSRAVLRAFQSAPPHGGRPTRRATSRPWR